MKSQHYDGPAGCGNCGWELHALVLLPIALLLRRIRKEGS